MTGFAVLAAALAGWLWVWPATGLHRLDALDALADPRIPGNRRPPTWLVALLAGAATAMLAGWPVGACAGCLGATAGGQWRRITLRRAAARERVEVVRTAQLLGGTLRSGLVPAAALQTSAVQAPLLTEAAAVQAMGGSVSPVLRRAAAVPGRAGMAEVARAWEVAERTGASMTASLDAVAERLAAADELRRTVEAELAAPRATGRLLAVLPAAGIALGYVLGGDPLGFLTGSLFGQACLVGGVGLGCAGLVWTELLAERSGG